MYIFRKLIEYLLMKSGISYDNIQRMSDKEIFEFMTIISEVNELERDKIEQTRSGV